MTGRLSAGTLFLLAVGVVAVSLAAPLMAQLAVPALAIAFWRNAMATALLAMAGISSCLRNTSTMSTANGMSSSRA